MGDSRDMVSKSTFLAMLAEGYYLQPEEAGSLDRGYCPNEERTGVSMEPSPDFDVPSGECLWGPSGPPELAGPIACVLAEYDAACKKAGRAAWAALATRLTDAQWDDMWARNYSFYGVRARCHAWAETKTQVSAFSLNVEDAGAALPHIEAEIAKFASLATRASSQGQTYRVQVVLERVPKTEESG